MADTKELLRQRAEQQAAADEKKRKKEEEFQASVAWEPKKATDYTPEEKVALFDDFHQQALDHYNVVKANALGSDERDKDADHYMFESVFGLLGKDVWTHYNRLKNGAE